MPLVWRGDWGDGGNGGSGGERTDTTLEGVFAFLVRPSSVVVVLPFLPTRLSSCHGAVYRLCVARSPSLDSLVVRWSVCRRLCVLSLSVWRFLFVGTA